MAWTTFSVLASFCLTILLGDSPLDSLLPFAFDGADDRQHHQGLHDVELHRDSSMLGLVVLKGRRQPAEARRAAARPPRHSLRYARDVGGQFAFGDCDIGNGRRVVEAGLTVELL